MDTCAALEVTPEQLLSGRGLDEEEGVDTSQKNVITPLDWQIIEDYHGLQEAQKRRLLAYAFTEQGIYMLMTVLRGELAIRQSKALVRTFKLMKDYIFDNRALIGQREYVYLSMQTAENMRDI